MFAKATNGRVTYLQYLNESLESAEIMWNYENHDGHGTCCLRRGQYGPLHAPSTNSED